MMARSGSAATRQQTPPGEKVQRHSLALAVKLARGPIRHDGSAPAGSAARVRSGGSKKLTLHVSDNPVDDPVAEVAEVGERLGNVLRGRRRGQRAAAGGRLVGWLRLV